MKPLLLALAILPLSGCCRQHAVPRQLTEVQEVCVSPIRCPSHIDADGNLVVGCGYITDEDRRRGFGCDTIRKAVTRTVYEFVCD